MFAETTDELLVVFRREMADKVEPYLWEDDEVFGYMTEAADALARDTNQLFEVIQLPVVAGTAVLDLPTRVLHIRSARLVTNGTPVTPRNTNSPTFARLTDDYGSYATSSMFTGTGKPRFYVRDYRAKAIQLVPEPDAADTLELQCTVTIPAALEAADDLPFLESVDIRLMLSFMKHLAYRKPDAETEDLKRANTHEGEYRIGVLEREADFRNQVRTPGQVRMEGW